MIDASDWPWVAATVVILSVIALGQVWAYRLGREGRPWRLIDVSNPLNWIGRLAIVVLPGYFIGRSRPYPSRIKPEKRPD